MKQLCLIKCLYCRGKDEDQVPDGMPPKVVEVYRSVGKIMSRYSAGKVPKAFKIIPNLKNWEEVSAPAAQTACPPAYRMRVQNCSSVSGSSTCLLLSCPGSDAYGIDLAHFACGMQTLLWHSCEYSQVQKKPLCRYCG